jgi:protein TonB
MSAHAYSEPHSYDRRHARNLLRTTAPAPVARKTADIVTLVPREYNRDKHIELVYPKYKTALASIALALIVGLHLAVFAYFYFKP